MREATNVSYQECVDETWDDCVTLCVLTARTPEWEQKQQKEINRSDDWQFLGIKGEMTQIVTAHSAYEEPNKTERRKRIQTPDIKGEIVETLKSRRNG